MIVGSPRVTVPVLSKTIVSTAASFSMARPLRTRIPRRPALVIDASTVVGTDTRMPVRKSVMRIEAATDGLRVSSSSPPESRKEGSRMRSAALAA